jgi:hypothetical protein
VRRIKLYATCFWQDDIALYQYLTNYALSKRAEFRNIEFTLSNKFDLAVIFTAPHKLHKYFKPDAAVIFLTEPPESNHHFKGSNVYVSKMYCPEIFWGCSGKDISLLQKGKFIKSECLSSVTSELTLLEGHQKRLLFIQYLDRIIQDGFSLFGKKYTGNYFKLISSYKGEIENKLNALVNFEYHFACENSFTKDYFTEKILQPILTQTLCFYDGCPNIFDYIQPEALVKIDISNCEAAANTIVNCILNNEYAKRKVMLQRESIRVQNQFNILNIIWAEVNGKDMPDYLKL